MAVYPFSHGNTPDPTPDAIAVELEAMETIARVLSGIRDPQIRQRVLQWTNERFNPVPTPTPQPPGGRTVVAEKLDESDLDVEPLYDLFDVPRPTARSHSSQAAPAPVANASATSAADSLYDFFEHPRAAAQSAAAQAAPMAIAPAAAAPVAPARELRAVPDACEPREEAALDTMVKGFATELQRLADEWQTT